MRNLLNIAQSYLMGSCLCILGSLLPHISLAQIAITEFLANPTLSDNGREWIELFNYSANPVNLRDWALGDEDLDNFVISASDLIINPGAYIILAEDKNIFESEWLGGIPNAQVIEWPVFTIGNNDDELVLFNEVGTIVWQIAYTNDDVEGRTTYLDYGHLFNNPVQNWGSKLGIQIDRNGLDPASSDLGYETHQSRPDEFLFTSTNNDQGSPLQGHHIAYPNGATLAFRGYDVSAQDLSQGTDNNEVYSFRVHSYDAAAQISTLSINLQTSGPNIDELLEQVKLFRSNDPFFDSKDSLVQILSPDPSPLQNLSFNVNDDLLLANTVSYYFISVDVLPTAITGSGFIIDPFTLNATFSLSSATPQISGLAGLIHNIINASSSLESDILALAASEAASISSIINSTAPLTTDPNNSTEVWRLLVRDGGGTPDLDSLPTLLSSLSISNSVGNEVSNWQNAIESAGLFQGSTLLATGQVFAQEIRFSGFTLSVPDDGEEALSIRISLQDNLNALGIQDGDDFGFRIIPSQVSSLPSGSGFQNFASQTSANGQNQVSVVATFLRFVTEPSDVGVREAMLPAPRLICTDIWGNIDRDFNGPVDLTSTGFLVTSPITENAVQGEVAFTNILHTTVGINLRLMAQSTGLLATQSNPFDVVQISQLNTGDLTLVGFNTNVGGGDDRIYLSPMVDIRPFTRIYLSNALYEPDALASTRSDTWDASGILQIELNDTLKAGDILEFDIPNLLPRLPDPSQVRLNGSIQANLLDFVNISGSVALSSSGAEQLYLMQGAWDDTFTQFQGTLLHGMTNLDTWRPFSEANPAADRRSRLHPQLECINLEFTGNTNHYYDGITTIGNQRDLVRLIHEESNWQTGTVPTYLSAGTPFQITQSWIHGTWIGDASNNWFDCASWEGLAVPDSLTNVLMNGFSVQNCVIPETPANQFPARCRDLRIQEQSLVIENNGAGIPSTLTVYGQLSLENNGTLDMDDGTSDPDGELFLYGNFGNFTNTSLRDAFLEGNSKIHFVGTSTSEQNIEINNGDREDFYQIVVDRPNSAIRLLADISVNNGPGDDLVLTQGDINLFGNDITLFNQASIQEVRGLSEEHLIYDNSDNVYGGPGKIFAPGNFYDETSFGTDIAGLGLRLQNKSGSGQVRVHIERGHLSIDDVNRSIRKSFLVQADSGTVDSTSLQFDYSNFDFESIPELTGTEASFTLSRLPDSTGAIWQNGLGNVDQAGNFVVFGGIRSFSTWTVASFFAPLPIRLISFQARLESEYQAKLEWVLQESTSLAQVIIEKSPNGWQFEEIARLDARPQSPWEFTDDDFEQEAYYRLHISETDGSSWWSDIRYLQVEASAPISFYPNPYSSQHSAHLLGLAPELTTQMYLYDLRGQELARGQARPRELELLLHKQLSQLSSGVYLLRLAQGERLQTLKIQVHP